MITIWVISCRCGDGERRSVFGHGPIVAGRCDIRLIGTSLPVPDEVCGFTGDSLTRTMSPSSRQRFVRSIRRSVRWFALKEYIGGVLWVLPSVAALIAIAAGYGPSQIDVRPGSRLNRLVDGLSGRYGSSDLIVMLALLRLFEKVAEVLPRGSARLSILDQAAAETLADAERSIARQPSLDRIRAAVRALRSEIDSQRTVGVMADESGGRS
jgi:uncharacterized membrane protein